MTDWKVDKQSSAVKKNPPRLLLRPTEAAEALALSPRLLWSLTAKGDIPAVRIGRTLRYDPRDLIAWIDRQKEPVEMTPESS